MKKNFLNYLSGIAFLMLFSAQVFAQTDRSKAPEPKKSSPVNIGKPEFFELSNGMKVYFVKETKAPSVSFSISFEMPPVLEKDKAGIGSMTASLVSRGSQKRTKTQIDEELDFVGATFMVGDGFIYGSSLTKHKDVLFDIASDVIMNPSFPSDELEKIRKQTLSGLKSNKSSADALASRVASKLLFGENHPYGENSTETTVNSITTDDCKAFYQKRFMPNVAYMSILGDITKEEAKKLAEKYFGIWKKGTPEKTEVPAVSQPKTPQVALVHKDGSVQSVISIGYALDFKMTSKDYLAAIILNQILGGGGFSNRLIQNIREDKGYTYGARSSLSANRYGGRFTAGANVRTGVTDSAVTEFLKEIKKLRDEKVGENELRLHKNIAVGSFARSLESSQTISRFAITAAREGLPADFYANYLKNIEALTADDLQKAAQKYFLPDNCFIVIAGDAVELKKKMEKFGKVTEYDENAKEVKPVVFDAGGLTAEQILAKNIEAIGGKDKLSKVKSLEILSVQTMQGMEVGVSYKKFDNKQFSVLVKLPMGMGEQKIVMSGDKAKMKSPMGNKEFSAEEVAGMKAEAQLFLELTYDAVGAKVELTGSKDFNGSAAHEITITLPSGAKSKRYYDSKTFLMVSKSDKQGTEVYSEHKEFEGIKFPNKGIIQSPRGELTLDVTNININKNVGEADFDLSF